MRCGLITNKDVWLLKEHIDCYNIMYVVTTRYPKEGMGWEGYTTGITPTDSDTKDG